MIYYVTGCRLILSMLLGRIVAFAACAALAQSPPLAKEGSTATSSEATPALQELKREVQKIKDDLGAIRRDELNYRTEKDLLKDSYSSQLQTVNTTTTIALGFLTAIGALLGTSEPPTCLP